MYDWIILPRAAVGWKDESAKHFMRGSAPPSNYDAVTIRNSSEMAQVTPHFFIPFAHETCEHQNIFREPWLSGPTDVYECAR